MSSSKKWLLAEIGAGIVIISLVYVYRMQIRLYLKTTIGTFCAGAQQGDQTPHLGELNTVGIGKFQKWANDKYSLGLVEDGTPDALTSTAYTQYGREFLTVLVDALGVKPTRESMTKIFA